jgi:hypothetical protein
MAMKETMEKMRIDNEYILGKMKIALEACEKGLTNKDGTIDAKYINELSKTLVEWSGEGAPQKTETNSSLRLEVEELVQRIQDKRDDV